jgi:hypothetical protein
MNKDNRFDAFDKYDGRKSYKKIQRIKEKQKINQKIRNIDTFQEGEIDDPGFESREKFRKK